VNLNSGAGVDLPQPKEMSMKMMRIGGIALSALVVVPVQASMAQSPQVAYASESRPADVVFFDKGASLLSGAAAEIIRNAAVDADRSAGLIRVVGRDDYAAVPLPAIADGVTDPSERRVEIRY
jgi:hypothetical protein